MRHGRERTVTVRSCGWLPVVLLIAHGSAGTALAAPAWGSNCLSCHDQWQPGTLEVFGEDTTADPDESATGAPDRGILKVFQVVPGKTATFQADVAGLDTGDTYAVELTRLRFPGVENGGELTYTGDCDWAEWDEPGDHYSDPAIAHRWGAGPTTFAFDLAVEPNTPYDYYDLVFAVAGKRADGSGLFYAEEHFYLQAVTKPGDLDEDGDVDLADFAAWIPCLTGPDVVPSPGCEAADLDGDNDVDSADFAAFQEAFTGS
jgi:hypothetical protein